MRADWFYERQPPSAFVIQEHLRQAIWWGGLGTAWIDVERVESPYLARGQWNDKHFSLEWERASWVKLTSDQVTKEVVDVFEQLLGFAPLATYTQDGQYIAEWWRRREAREQRWEELRQDERIDELERKFSLPLYA